MLLSGDKTAAICRDEKKEPSALEAGGWVILDNKQI